VDESTPSGSALAIEADLTLQQIAGGTVSSDQSLKISTQADGTILLSSQGTLPRTSLRQIIQAREGLRRFAEATRQDVIIDHNGRQVARLLADSKPSPKWSIRWWTVFRYALRLS